MDLGRLDQLIKILKYENTRSYFLNALTSRKNSKKIDLSLFEDLVPGIVSKSILELLENGIASLSINMNDFDGVEEIKKAFFLKSLLKTQIRHRSTEIRDIGIDSLRFGYPMVSRIEKEIGGKIIYAPLFTWKADLKFDSEKGDFNLILGVDGDWMVNSALFAFQSTQDEEEPRFDTSLKILENKTIIDKVTLEEFVISIQKSIPDFEPHHSDSILPSSIFELSKIPQRKADLIKFNPDTPVEYKIHNSAVLGLFKSTKEPIIKDLEAYIENLSEVDFTSSSLSLNLNSAFDLDPSQLSGYDVINSNKNLVIHGPPGTGKSTVLSGIISSALKENKKILFVCEKLTALEVIKDKLKEKDLDLEVAFIRDIISDKKKVLQQAKELITSNSISHVYTEGGSLAEYERQIGKHQKHIEALEFPFLFDWSYKKCCGRRLHLRNKGIHVPEFSESFLTTIKESSESTLSRIREVEFEFFEIKERDAYCRVLSLNSDANFFSLRETLDELSTETKKIYKSYMRLKDKATNKSLDLVNDKIISLKETIKELDYLLVGLKDHQEKIQIYFEQGSFKKTIKTRFSKPYQKVKLLIEDIKKLNESVGDPGITFNASFHTNVQEYFNLRLKEWEKKKLDLKGSEIDVSILEQYVPDLFGELREYQRAWYELLKGEVFKPQIAKLEEGSIDIVESLSLMSKDLNSINSYIDYVDLIDDLGLSKFEKDWVKLHSLSNWYEYVELALLNNVFNTSNINAYSDLHTNSRVIDRIKDKHEQIVSNEPKSLKHKLQTYRDEYLDLFRSNNNVELNQLFSLGRSNRNNLLKLFTDYRDLMSSIFPLMLMTPQAASTLFRGAHKYFDLVLFDEASQLTIEDAFSSILKAKKIIISGDEHQMPPSKFFLGEVEEEEDEELDNEGYWEKQALLDESLLKFGINNERNFKSSYLDFHYRSQHHRLIDFSNAAFYKRLIPIPQRYDYKPIDFYQVDGFFDDGKNHNEADKTIKVLQSLSDEFIKNNSVGVATLNVQQQKLIWSLIDEMTEQDPDFRKKIMRLENNGFFVKNLDSLQGDERDLIILNVCYGRKSDNNSFRRSFGMLNRITGHRLLNVLITRARRRMIVLNSIPATEFQSYNDHLMTRGNRGFAVFYAYLNYAKAVSENDREQIASTLSALRNDVVAKGRIFEELESPFEEEVYEMLRAIYSDDEITIAEEDSGFRIDMVLRPKSNPGLKIAIECDGAAYHSGYKNHYADLHRQKILEGSGYVFVRIWGKSWYLGPENEFQGLEKKIKNIISDYRENVELPSFTKPFNIDLAEARQSEQLSDVLIEEEPQLIAKDKYEDLYGKEDVFLQPIDLQTKIRLGTRVKLKELKSHLKEVELTISGQTNAKDNTLSIESQLTNSIRKHKVGEEFNFGKYRYRLLSVQ